MQSGSVQRSSGSRKRYKVLVYDSSEYHVMLSDILESKGLKPKSPTSFLPNVVSSLVDSIIVLPRLEPGQIQPCPFENLALALGHKTGSHVVKEVIDILRRNMLDHIEEKLMERRLDTLLDIEPRNGGFIHLTGEDSYGY